MQRDPLASGSQRTVSGPAHGLSHSVDHLEDANALRVVDVVVEQRKPCLREFAHVKDVGADLVAGYFLGRSLGLGSPALSGFVVGVGILLRLHGLDCLDLGPVVSPWCSSPRRVFVALRRFVAGWRFVALRRDRESSELLESSGWPGVFEHRPPPGPSWTSGRSCSRYQSPLVSRPSYIKAVIPDTKGGDTALIPR